MSFDSHPRIVEVSPNAAKKAAARPQTPTKPLTKLDLNELRARRQARLTGQTPDGDVALTPEELGSYAREYLKLVAEENEYNSQLQSKDRKEAGGFVSVEDLNREINDIQTALTTVRKDRQQLAAFKGVVDEATRLGKTFDAAQTVIESASGLTAGYTKKADIDQLLAYAVGNGVLQDDPNGTVRWIGRSYSPTTEDDVVLTAAQTLADFLTNNESQRDADRRAEEFAFADHLVSYDQVQALKHQDGTTRSLVEFLIGQGVRYILPINGNNRAGQEKFFGLLILESTPTSGKFTYNQISKLEGARALFSYRQKPDDTRVIKKGSQVFVVKKAGENFDFSEVKSNLLRENLHEKLQQEAKSAEIREAAAELRDLDTIDNPITFQDLRTGQVGTWPVDIDWEAKGSDRPTRQTFHVEGLDVKDGCFRVTNMAPGVLEKDSELNNYAGQAALTELDKPYWKAKLFRNGKMELAVRAKQLSAAYITKDTVDGLVNQEKGVDGVYAVYTNNWRKKVPNSDKPLQTSVYYIMERAGDTIKILWAAAGDSIRAVTTYGSEERVETFPVADPPSKIRAVLRSVYMGVQGLHGYAGAQQVPDNIKQVEHPQTSTSDATTPDQTAPPAADTVSAQPESEPTPDKAPAKSRAKRRS